jgi:hypothetical protein
MSDDFWKRFYPTSSVIGFIKTDFDKLYQAYREWMYKIKSGKHISIESGNIDMMFERLRPHVMPQTKDCFIQTKSEWIAFFDNGTYGPDPFSSVTYMSEVLECEAVIAGFSENTVKSNIGRGEGTYGNVQFEYYSPESDEFLHLKRAVAAINDGGRWVFVDEGEPLIFEDTSRYSAVRTANRFDRPMLEAYCSAMGIEIYDGNFYGNKFILACKPER